jgi:hypothetical protein
MILFDVRGPTLAIVCAACGRRTEVKRRSFQKSGRKMQASRFTIPSRIAIFTISYIRSVWPAFRGAERTLQRAPDESD